MKLIDYTSEGVLGIEEGITHFKFLAVRMMEPR
jgi:hypothetical protein